jgi:spermidine synthase
MTSQRPASPATPAVSPRFLPLLVLLFVGSGCAALIYEIVWFQLLSLIIGSSAVSLGVLLVVFMGGMCIGSVAFARVISAREHPLRMYAFLELGIAAFGILVLYGLPYAGGLYTAIGGPGFGGLLLRGLFCMICLLPPTLLMGATLPAIARWVEATPKGVSWLGFFYGGNIAGAVFGCLLAGFYLLRVHDMAVATYVAMALNIVVAVAGLTLARATAHEAPAVTPTAEDNAIPRDAWPVYATIALSGMTALGAEVIWTRLLSLMLGATVYTFSLILGVFLFGLGIGSSVGSVLARTLVSPRRALGWCQFLVMGSLAWAAWSISQVLPYWPIHPGLATAPRFLFEMDMLRSLWVVLPGAVLWGASFPLALAAVAARRQDLARLVGTVYAANTVGAIVGAAMASLILVSWFGTQNAQRILIGVAAVSAAIMLAPVFSTETGRFRLESRSALRIGATLAVAALLMWSVTPIPPLLIAYGRWMVTWIGNHGEILYTGEGMNSSMAVSRLANGDLNYHNAGKVQASSEPQDMRLQRMLGHLTTLVPANPGNVLVIGCGAGVTAGAVSINPMVKNVTIAEIEPLVPKFVAEHFGEHNYHVVKNPKVAVRIDDARHFLLTTDETYDAITSDPFDPWVKGAATLYTKEFFQLAKRHLKPGGVITVFVQLYESGMPAVKSEVATFLEVFPNGIVWGNTHNGGGYDVVLMGQAQPGPINVDSMEARLARPDFAEVAQSLREIGFNSATDLLSTYAGDGPHLQPWLADAQINTDRNLRLQYLAGLGVNKYEQATIYAEMLSYRQPPDGIFAGSPERLAALRMGIMGYP